MLGPVETAARILGPTGMLSRGARLPQIDAPHPHPPALPALAEWIAQGGAVLALGPLTNLATAMLAHPDLPLHHVTWMGGSTGGAITRPSPNTTPSRTPMPWRSFWTGG